ncbi:MAG: GNAT family N-acetyltransferase [Verrucomicrobiota bacterium]
MNEDTRLPPKSPHSGDDSKRPIQLSVVAPDEASQVRAMAVQIWPGAYDEILTSKQIDFMIEKMYRPETIQREIENEGTLYRWVCLHEDRIGFTAFGPLDPLATAPLHKLYLLPETQGKGIGKRTMEAIVDEVSSIGGRAVELRVNRNNRNAILFYERFGFRTVSDDVLPIGGGFVMDDHIMRFELP